MSPPDISAPIQIQPFEWWARPMSKDLEDLRQRMEAAATALDFEEAVRLRDQLSLLRG